MASVGRKPKPAHLKVVTGNPGKRPIKDDPAEGMDPGFDNGLEPPKRLKKREAELWATYVRRASWLTEFDVPRAFMWTVLTAEFERSHKDMPVGRIAQLRALGSELGFDPGSRQRLGGKEDPGKGKGPGTDRFFD